MMKWFRKKPRDMRYRARDLGQGDYIRTRYGTARIVAMVRNPLRETVTVYGFLVDSDVNLTEEFAYNEWVWRIPR